MQSLAEPYSAVEGHQDDQGRPKIRLLPSAPVGLLLIPVVLSAAVLAAILASSAIERWYAVRFVFRGTLEPSSIDPATERWSTYSGSLAIAAGTAIVMLSLWSALATANARRLLAVPNSIPPQTSRIVVGAAFLATSLAASQLFETLDWSHILATSLALVGLAIVPAPFSHITRVANLSTVVVAPFRRWRGMVSLAFMCTFASQLLVRQRWGLGDLGDELSTESLAYVAADRAAAAAPKVAEVTTTLAPVTTTIDPNIVTTTLDPNVATTLAPTASDVAQAVVAPRPVPPSSLGGVTWQAIEQRLMLDAVLMPLTALAVAWAAASVIVGVWSLDRRHREFARHGYTIREAKSLR